MTQKERRDQSIVTLEKIVNDCAAYECEKVIKELQERCSSLESLLAECGKAFLIIGKESPYFMEWDLVEKIYVILPKQKGEHNAKNN